MRLDAWRQYVQRLHGMMVAVGVVLRYLHRLKLLKACLLLYLVVALVGVVLKMSHVGDVAHIAHLISEMLEITEEDVKRDGGTGMSQMRVAIHCGTAHIHTDIG